MYKFLLRRKIERIIKYSEREKAYISLKEIKSVLVLFDTRDFDDANHFIQQLKKMEKRVKAIAFRSRKDAKDYSKILYPMVTEKDMMDLKNESLTQSVNSLSNEKFDLIVDFTLEENLLFLFILASVNSPLKVGFYKHALSIHDIVISFTTEWVQNVNELGQQLIHYLTIISSAAR